MKIMMQKSILKILAGVCVIMPGLPIIKPDISSAEEIGVILLSILGFLLIFFFYVMHFKLGKGDKNGIY